MYRIRLPSGTEQIYTSIQELADAVRQGSVGRDASIYHRRSGQWLPLESHPYFAYASSEAPEMMSGVLASSIRIESTSSMIAK